MERRPLGRSGLMVSKLCFGGNVFGWTADENTSFQLLDAFLAGGGNFIDTADVYSKWKPGNKGGESETLIGKWLKRTGKRADVIIATKVGMELSPTDKGLKHDYILRAAEKSLQRLQTDRIDLYQSHIDDASTPLEETLAAYDQLIKQGKVRAIGASNYTAERLVESLKISRERNLPRYESLQPEYSLVERKAFEEKLQPLCVKENIGVISYFSLARGFLTGKYRSEADLSKSPRGGGVQKYLNPQGFRVIAALEEVAKQLHSTPASVALAWLMTRPAITAPIASATNLEQLKTLLDAAQLQLDQNALMKLDQASAG